MRIPAKTNEIIHCTRTRVAQVRCRQQQTRSNGNQYIKIVSTVSFSLRVNIDIHEMVNGIEVQNPAKRLVNCRWITSCPISSAMMASVAIICMMARIVTIADGKRSLKRGSWVNTPDDRCRARAIAVLAKSVERSAHGVRMRVFACRSISIYFSIFLSFSSCDT